MSGFESKCAFVTGAGSGIGRATAIELARRGAKVAIHYFKNQKGAAETAEAIAGRRLRQGQFPWSRAISPRPTVRARRCSKR